MLITYCSVYQTNSIDILTDEEFKAEIKLPVGSVAENAYLTYWINKSLNRANKYRWLHQLPRIPKSRDRTDFPR